MISVILYGRNDSYGYNLHKRAAISFNCIAENLTDPDDEIIFVDYNTPNDFPTFPEAIADTLTDVTKMKLRILRVRPHIHEELYAGKTHLKALEPISRNIAVRRSNSENRWILSTNTDMVFVPHDGVSLTNAVSNLSKKFYCAPRIEIPETLWEGFERFKPLEIISEIRKFGSRYHLNEVVFGSSSILYDAPGDFQLIDRNDLFSINGFDEEMLLGWHVDSNISKRLMLLNGPIGDGGDFVFGYHCDHTRQVTPMHAPNSPQNDPNKFIYEVNEPQLTKQENVWGLPEETIEELSLKSTSNSKFITVLDSVIENSLDSPTNASYNFESYDKESVTPEHLIPFLVDLFISKPRNLKLAWLGATDELFSMFSLAWKLLKFENDIFTISSKGGLSKIVEIADEFVINFGVPLPLIGVEADQLASEFWVTYFEEVNRLYDKQSPRHFVHVNVIHNRYEKLVMEHFSCAKTQFSSRIRHGYINENPIKMPKDWTNLVWPGNNGHRMQGEILSKDKIDHIFYGPYLALPPGEYEISVLITVNRQNKFSANVFRLIQKFGFTLETVINEKIFSAAPFELAPGDHELTLPLMIKSNESLLPIQIRFGNKNYCSLRIKRVMVHRKKIKDWSTVLKHN